MEQKQTEMCKKFRETGLVGNFIPKAVLFLEKNRIVCLIFR